MKLICWLVGHLEPNYDHSRGVWGWKIGVCDRCGYVIRIERRPEFEK